MKRILISLLLFSLPSAGIAQPMNLFLSGREPIDLAKATAASDVLLVADDHTQPEIKMFLMHRLKTLKALGFRCLAIEMLPSRFQTSLDSWGEADQGKVRRHLTRFWGEKGPSIADCLFDLIAEAKHEGFMVVALDADEAPSMDRQDMNPHWAQCVKRCRIGENGAKMIVFGGSSHFQPRPRSALTLLNDQGIHCSVWEFSGLENPRSVELDLKTAQLLGREASLPLQLTAENQRLGWHGAFMHPYKDDASVARWIINLEPDLQLASLPISK
jgi:hypothetical protein